LYEFATGSVVEVVTRSVQQNAAHAWDLDIRGDSSDTGLARDQLEGAVQLDAKQVRRRWTILRPPGIGLADLASRDGRDDQPQG
jgi:hypothetical protein